MIVIGFKLGHFIYRNAGHMKAVIWSERETYRHAFNPTYSNEEEETEKFLLNNRGVIELEISDVKQIYGIGVNSDLFEYYDEDIPELMIVADDDNVIHLLKG